MSNSQIPFPSGEGNSATILVAPRYLAGNTGDLGPVTDLLDAARWFHYTERQHTLRYVAPNHWRCVTHLPEDTQPVMRGRKTAWHMWGREVGRHWRATITRACPEEIVGGLTTALATAPYGDASPPDDDAATPLVAAGWQRGQTLFAARYTAPDGHVMVYAPRARHVAPCYVNVRLYPDGPPLWQARFTPTTPTRLVTAFFAALTDPTPVQRRERDLDPLIRPHLHVT